MAEVLQAPGLLQVIQLLVVQDQRPRRLLLTGSVNVLVLPQASGAMVGTMEVLGLGNDEFTPAEPRIPNQYRT